MKTKEEWIGNVMESLDGLEVSGCPAELKEKLMKGIPVKGRRVPLYSSSLLWKAAAVILVLIALNIFTIVQFRKSEGEENTAGTAAKEYFSYIDTFNL